MPLFKIQQFHLLLEFSFLLSDCFDFLAFLFPLGSISQGLVLIPCPVYTYKLHLTQLIVLYISSQFEISPVVKGGMRREDRMQRKSGAE